MGVFKTRALSPELVDKGIWVELGGERARVRFAGPMNREFVSAVQRADQEAGKAQQFWTPKQNRLHMARIVAKVIITDWLVERDNGTLNDNGDPIQPGYVGARYVRGMTDTNDEIVPMSYEQIVFVMTELDSVYDDILACARNEAGYLKKYAEEAAKNLLPSSNTD